MADPTFRNLIDGRAICTKTHLSFVSEMPHDGHEHSGYGKDLSMYGLEDYARVTHVMSYTGE